MYGPANLPAPVTQRLSGILAASLTEAETRTTFERNGVEAIGGGPDALARYTRKELERWGAVIRRANITVDRKDRCPGEDSHQGWKPERLKR